MMTFAVCFEPTKTAMNCLPLTVKVTGGALMPVPVLKLQSSLSVLASWAKNVPSGWPRNTRLPAVASKPLEFG